MPPSPEARPPRVFLTGAAGTLGRVLAPVLAEAGCRPVLSDLRPLAGPLPADATTAAADLTDLASLEAACPGDVRAIVHFGGINTEKEPDAILAANVAGTVNVFELARRRGARVIYASSNHVVGFYERGTPVTAADPYRPDGFYGLSKIYAETLGRLYFDKFGVESVHLRIGSCLPRPTEQRHLATWLSYSDLGRLVLAAVTARHAGHAIVWGISRNPESWWSGDDAARIGYVPRDEAGLYEGDVAPDPGSETARRFQGGPLCEPPSDPS